MKSLTKLKRMRAGSMESLSPKYGCTDVSKRTCKRVLSRTTKFVMKAMPKIFRVSGDFTEKLKCRSVGENLFYLKKCWSLGSSTKVVTKRVKLV